MSNYTHEAGSKYPNELLTLTNYLDADSTMGDVIAQFKSFQSKGEYSEAAQYLIDNPNLKKYIFGSSDINKLSEELRNTQIKALNVAQQLFYQENSPIDYASSGDIWISSTEM